MTLDYPVALQLEGRPVLLVGGGEVATGRLMQLLDVGAKVTVVAPHVSPRILRAAAEGKCSVVLRPFDPGDCEGAELVFTATDDPKVNSDVVKAARSRKLWANAADQPALCDFTLPSVGRQGPVTVAVSTSGHAPGLARLLRHQLMTEIGPEHARLARLIRRLRRVLPAGPRRMRALSGLVEAGAAEMFAKRDWQGLRLLVRTAAVYATQAPLEGEFR